MSLLGELQSAFADALMRGDAGNIAANALIRPGRLATSRRLEIYRHNVMVNLRAALADIYPAVKEIVGAAFFTHAADQFIAIHPSVSGDLNQFGREWAGFLDAYPHAAELPYLADIARLEWAWHESFHAADHPLFDLARLAAIAPEKHGQLKFELHSSVRLISSAFPLFRIWEVNQPDYPGTMEVDWSAGGDDLLVHRQGVEVNLRQLDEPSCRFLRALEANAELENVAGQVMEIDTSFDLQGLLLEFVQSGVIVNFTLEQT
jgi:hypothetical protein